MTEATAHALTITRAFEASVEQLFAAWTDPEQVTQWMGPGDVTCLAVKIDLKTGGAYRIEMKSDEGDHVAYGEYREVVPNQRLQFTWSWETGSVEGSLVTLDFRSTGEGSELTLNHENLPDSDLTEKHTMGWGGCLANLETHLSGLEKE